MISADILARELGCTLSDLEDLDRGLGTLNPEHMIYNMHADMLRAEWSKRAGLDYTENELIRATTLDHRVKSVHASTATVSTVLDCSCGHRLRSYSENPEDALHRLYKSHALHVATFLMSIEAGE